MKKIKVDSIVRDAVESSQLNKVEIAEELGVHRNTFAGWLDDAYMTVKNIRAIGECIDVDFSKLLPKYAEAMEKNEFLMAEPDVNYRTKKAVTPYPSANEKIIELQAKLIDLQEKYMVLFDRYQALLNEKTGNNETFVVTPKH